MTRGHPLGSMVVAAQFLQVWAGTPKVQSFPHVLQVTFFWVWTDIFDILMGRRQGELSTLVLPSQNNQNQGADTSISHLLLTRGQG